MRHGGLRGRVVDEPIHECPIEVEVHQPGSLALELMRHSAGAEYGDPLIAGVGIDGPPDPFPN